MRSYYKTSLPLSYFYDKYQEKAKNKNITRIKYNKIINLAHELIVKGIIEDNFIFSPPYLPFKFRIRKYKQKIKYDKKNNIIKSNLPINWKATKDYWKNNPTAKDKKIVIYHLNDHTDGYRFRFYKYHRAVCLKVLRYYNFKPSRKNDRLLASHILNPLNHIEYYE